MASKLLFLSVICLLTIDLLLINCDLDKHYLDSDPKELELKGDPTKSAEYGWHILLNDISKSFKTTKLFQNTEGKGRKVIKNLVTKSEDIPKIKYSPKRSSKCMFGTPYPQINCEPDIVAKMMTDQFEEYANRLWTKYFSVK